LLLNKIDELKKHKYDFSYYLDEFRSEVSKTLELNNQRYKIQSVPRYSRISPVLRFLINGGYYKFRGVKSAIRDLIFK
jgi:hypothetical protein